MSRERLEPSALSPLERQLLIGASSSQSKPKIQSIGTSPLLSQLKQFLPKMQLANVELQQKLQECDPAELDIEHIPGEEGQEEEGPVIQMDLACGLLDLKDDAAVAAAQRAIAAGGDISVETYDGGSSSDSDSGSESDSESESESESEGEGEGADVSNGAVAGRSVAGRSRGKAAQPASAAAEAAADGDVVMEDKGQPASAAAAEVSKADGQQQGTEQQQQQAGKQRRKLTPKKPMIVELP